MCRHIAGQTWAECTRASGALHSTSTAADLRSITVDCWTDSLPPASVLLLRCCMTCHRLSGAAPPVNWSSCGQLSLTHTTPGLPQSRLARQCSCGTSKTCTRQQRSSNQVACECWACLGRPATSTAWLQPAMTARCGSTTRGAQCMPAVMLCTHAHAHMHSVHAMLVLCVPWSDCTPPNRWKKDASSSTMCPPLPPGILMRSPPSQCTLAA